MIYGRRICNEPEENVDINLSPNKRVNSFCWPKWGAGIGFGLYILSVGITSYYSPEFRELINNPDPGLAILIAGPIFSTLIGTIAGIKIEEMVD